MKKTLMLALLTVTAIHGGNKFDWMYVPCKPEKVVIDGKERIVNVTHSGTKFSRKNTCEFGAYANGVEKLVISQTNPCLFFDKEEWRTWKGKKIDDRTISLEGKNLPIDFTENTRPDLGLNLRFTKDGVQTKDGYAVVQVLGSGECYVSRTTETWRLYNEHGRLVGTVRFTINP